MKRDFSMVRVRTLADVVACLLLAGCARFSDDPSGPPIVPSWQAGPDNSYTGP